MQKIEELNICNIEKQILEFLSESPRNIYQVAAELNVAYDTAYKRIKVLLAKELVVRVGNKRPSFYFINTNRIDKE